MGPSWGPSGADRTQMGPMLAPWTLLSRTLLWMRSKLGTRDPTLLGLYSLRRHHLIALQWHHNGRDSISNHQPHDYLLNRLFRRRSKKTSKLRVTGLCEWNSLGTGEFPGQMASNEKNVSISWRHHGYRYSPHKPEMVIRPEAFDVDSYTHDMASF